LDFKELEKHVEYVAHDLMNEKPEFNTCKTKPGIKFQKELNDLLTLVRTGNFVPMMFDLSNWVIEGIIQMLSKEDVLDQNEVLELKSTQEISKIPEVKITIKDILKSLKLPDYVQKIIDNLPLFLEPLNSYYILALFAYIDYYSTSIYEVIISENCNDNVKELLLYLRPRRNPNTQINILVDNLDLITKTELNKLLVGKTWKKTFEKLINLRNILAHEEPKVKKQALFDNFQKLHKIVKKKLVLIFKQQNQKKLDAGKDINLELQELMRPYLEILLLQVEIGKECYGYLSLIDLLIYNFLEIENVEDK